MLQITAIYTKFCTLSLLLVKKMVDTRTHTRKKYTCRVRTRTDAWTYLPSTRKRENRFVLSLVLTYIKRQKLVLFMQNFAPHEKKFSRTLN